jgi:hypothetical protein
MSSHEVVEVDRIDVVIVRKVAQARGAVRQDQAYIMPMLGFIRVGVLGVGGILVVLAIDVKPDGVKRSSGRRCTVGQGDELRHDNPVWHFDLILLTAMGDEPSDVEDDNAGPGDGIREEHRSLLLAMEALRLGHFFPGTNKVQKILDMNLLVSVSKRRPEVAIGEGVHGARGVQDGVQLVGTRVIETGLIRNLGGEKRAGKEVRMAPLESLSKERSGLGDEALAGAETRLEGGTVGERVKPSLKGLALELPISEKEELAIITHNTTDHSVSLVVIRSFSQSLSPRRTAKHALEEGTNKT